MICGWARGRSDARALGRLHEVAARQARWTARNSGAVAAPSEATARNTRSRPPSSTGGQGRRTATSPGAPAGTRNSPTTWVDPPAQEQHFQVGAVFRRLHEPAAGVRPGAQRVVPARVGNGYRRADRHADAAPGLALDIRQVELEVAGERDVLVPPLEHVEQIHGPPTFAGIQRSPLSSSSLKSITTTTRWRFAQPTRERPDGVDDPLLVGLRQIGVHRQGQHRLGLGLGHRQAAGPAREAGIGRPACASARDNRPPSGFPAPSGGRPGRRGWRARSRTEPRPRRRRR